MEVLSPCEALPSADASALSPVRPSAAAADADVEDADASGACASASADSSEAAVAAAVAAAVKAAYRGTGIARRTGGRPLTEYIQKKRPSNRKKAKAFDEPLDLGAKMGACRRCTCPVHEADITDGYAEQCADGTYECLQEKYADSCQEYKESHPEDVAAAAAAGLIMTDMAAAAAAAEEAAEEAAEDAEEETAAAEAATTPEAVAAPELEQPDAPDATS
jgi:hypothetical protein